MGFFLFLPKYIANQNLTKMKLKQLLLTLFIVAIVSTINAQNDSLILLNKDVIIGEAKTMVRGVLTYDTDYADSDFKIKWDNVSEIYTKTIFLITMSDGSRYNGHLESAGPGKMVIVTTEGERHETNRDDIVDFDDIDQGFWSQLYFSLDVGFDLTKANNFSQFSTRSSIGYDAKRWGVYASYNTLYSKQDDVADISRTDGGVGGKYYLPKDWYPLIDYSFLKSTELLLDLRSTVKMGMGKYVLHTIHSYWGFSVGANYNNEDYSSDAPTRKSWEGFFGTELNLYDIGDLSLMTNILAYPSFTESGRWRTDFNFDARYEMPFDDDFYITLGVTFNYDNRPVEGASETDYVFHTGFGWEW